MKSIRQKAEEFALSFFLSDYPQKDFEEILAKLDKQEIWDYSSDIIIWEPFENNEPKWVADQINIMAYQLAELFSENVK